MYMVTTSLMKILTRGQSVYPAIALYISNYCVY
jgi:hypothetical protein